MTSLVECIEKKVEKKQYVCRRNNLCANLSSFELRPCENFRLRLKVGQIAFLEPMKANNRMDMKSF